MILIDFNGEQQLVESIDGYEGCTVIAEDVGAPPSDHCTFADGAWVEDTAAKAAAEQAAQLNTLSKAELVQMLQTSINEQASRIDTLTTQVATVADAAGVIIAEEPPAG